MLAFGTAIFGQLEQARGCQHEETLAKGYALAAEPVRKLIAHVVDAFEQLATHHRYDMHMRGGFVAARLSLETTQVHFEFLVAKREGKCVHLKQIW